MTTRLPGTDLDLFPLVLGGNVFGWTRRRGGVVRRPRRVRRRRAARFVDTADAYAAGSSDDGGESETIIGAWMAARGNRDDVVVATKMGKLAAVTRPAAREHPRRVRRLAAPPADRPHRPLLRPPGRRGRPPQEEYLEAFDGLVRAGKVRASPPPTSPAARLAEALEPRRPRTGWAPFVALQPHYNLVEREEYETEYAHLCLQRGLGTLPYFGLARGFLTGKYRGGADIPSVRADGVTKYADERGDRVLSTLQEVADAHGVPMAAVALAWLRTRPAVVAPIASARTVEQLADLLRIVDVELDESEESALDAASA